MIISGKFDYNHREIGLIEPTQSITSRIGLLVARSLVQTEKSVIPVRVANLTDKMITLSGDSTIALLQPINKVSNFSISKDQGSVLSLSNGETCNNKPALPDHLRPLMESLSIKLSVEQVRKFEKLLTDYQDIFVGPDEKLGSTTLTEHSIETGDHPPIKLRPRRLPIAQRDVIQKELDKMEVQGLIECSDSPWASPLVIVTKKDGSVRVCVYRALNEISRKCAVGLPNTQGVFLLLKVLGSFVRWISLVVIIKFQCLRKISVRQLSTAGNKGLMQFMVMPFGLTTTPSSSTI